MAKRFTSLYGIAAKIMTRRVAGGRRLIGRIHRLQPGRCELAAKLNGVNYLEHDAST
jgi:hypothetical protein